MKTNTNIQKVETAENAGGLDPLRRSGTDFKKSLGPTNSNSEVKYLLLLFKKNSF